MAIQQILKVWRHELPHNEQAVALAYADHANEDGTGMWPSTKRIEYKTGYSRRTVQRIRKSMVDKGLLVKVCDAGEQRPAEYRFNWSAVERKPEFDEWRGENMTPGGRKNDAPGGDTHDARGASRMTPEPSYNRKKEPSSRGSARGRADGMPDELLPLYDTYRPEVEALLGEYDGPPSADALVMNQWGQAGISQTIMRLAKEHEWPYFVAGVVITANEANSPNARYLDSLLEAITQLDEHTADDPTEHEQQSNLQRLWNAAQEA